MPSNIFYGTSIPTCILVLSKCRVNSQNILFIDASNDFEKDANKNKLTEENIAKIIDTYRQYHKGETPLLRGDGGVLIDKYAYIATIDQIKENDYNLNISRYVDTFEEEEAIDIDAVANNLKALENDIKTTDKTITDFCKQLNITTPF